jgi:hypothetical protein
LPINYFKGVFARKVLQRKSFVIENDNFETNTTTVTLFILEGRAMDWSRYYCFFYLKYKI